MGLRTIFSAIHGRPLISPALFSCITEFNRASSRNYVLPFSSPFSVKYSFPLFRVVGGSLQVTSVVSRSRYSRFHLQQDKDRLHTLTMQKEKLTTSLRIKYGTIIFIANTPCSTFRIPRR